MKKMLTLSNSISLLRAPLAFLFLFPSVKVRVVAVILAMITDCIDGYFARKFKSVTFFGKILDPLMDKFFVYVVIAILFFDKTLSNLGLFALLTRDLAVFLYVISTIAIYGWKGLLFKPAYSSKLTTAFQLLIFIALILGYTPPNLLYFGFIFLGPIIYIELMISTRFRNKKGSLSYKDRS
jgi:CDP-diacylglycerol--glycerol-3-phosphate 3-phosphatidyltransferase